MQGQFLLKQRGLWEDRLFHVKSSPAPLLLNTSTHFLVWWKRNTKEWIIQNGEKVACDYHQADQDFQNTYINFECSITSLLSAARNEIQELMNPWRSGVTRSKCINNWCLRRRCGSGRRPGLQRLSARPWRKTRLFYQPIIDIWDKFYVEVLGCGSILQGADCPQSFWCHGTVGTSLDRNLGMETVQEYGNQCEFPISPIDHPNPSAKQLLSEEFGNSCVWSRNIKWMQTIVLNWLGFGLPKIRSSNKTSPNWKNRFRT